METTHVDGKDKGKVMLYTLSTCGWCRKTKALLKDLDVAYDYIDVDLLKGDAQDEVVKETLVTRDGKIVNARVREAFGI